MSQSATGGVRNGMLVPQFKKGKLVGPHKANILAAICRAATNPVFRSQDQSLDGSVQWSDGNLVIEAHIADNQGPQSTGSIVTPMIVTGIMPDYWQCLTPLGVAVNVAKPYDLRNSNAWRSVYQYATNGTIILDPNLSNAPEAIPVKATYAGSSGFGTLEATFTPQGTFAGNYDAEYYIVLPEIVIGTTLAFGSAATTSGVTTINLAAACPWGVGTALNITGVTFTPAASTTWVTLTNHGTPSLIDIAGTLASGSATSGTVTNVNPTTIFAVQTGGNSGVIVSGADIDWIDLNVDCRAWCQPPLSPNP